MKLPVLHSLLGFLVLAGSPGICLAGPAPAELDANAPAVATTPDDSHLSIYDKIWNAFILYENEENPVLQQFALQGRLQAQWATGDSDQGSYGTWDLPNESLWGDFEIRRWRLGFKSKWYRVWKLEGQIDVNPQFERVPGSDPDLNGDGFYRQIYDLYLNYAPSDSFNLGVGKYKANFFGIEHYTSSKEILTFERGLLSNAIFTGELTGIKFNGKKNDFVYGAGLYAGDQQREFSEFNGGWVFQTHFGYDFHDELNWDKAQVKLDYQYAEGDELDTSGGRRFEHAVSLNGHFEKERFGLYSEILGAAGHDDTAGDVWGITLLPSYFVAEGLQLVLRYQYAHGENDGIALQRRYERLAPDLTDGGAGEDYHAVYLGLNYYLYGHKLKLMAGTEYHYMDGGRDGGDFDGWTTLIGMRMFF